MQVEVVSRVRGDGGVEWTAIVDTAAWRLELARSDLAFRNGCLDRVSRMRDAFDRSSYWRSSQMRIEQGVAELDAAYHALYHWDLCEIVRPLLANLEQQFPGESWLVVAEGRPALPLFDIRAALRSGILRGSAPPQALAVFSVVHAWAGRGCAALREFTAPNMLPKFRASALHFVIGPPPSEIDDYFGTLARHRQVAHDILIRETLEIEQDRVVDMVARAKWQAGLLDAVIKTARTLGAFVRSPATRKDLANVLARCAQGSLLVVIAHQDRDGIHLADGPLALPVFGQYLYDLRERAIRPCASVDLGVCHANAEGNLADCFQAFGIPVVHTHGRYAHFGRVLATWLWALRTLADGDPRSLPALLDEGWIRGLCDQGE